MRAWNDTVTADTYEDQGMADIEATYRPTSLLRKYGCLLKYLLMERQGASRNDYQEVKTTTLGCGMRLSVRRAQYQGVSKMLFSKTKAVVLQLTE